MKIKNTELLTVTDMRKSALAIAEAGLQAIDTTRIIDTLVHRQGSQLTIGKKTIDLGTIDKLILIGVGKCALDATAALEEVLGEYITGGIVLYPSGTSRLKHVTAIQGTHPLPSPENVRGSGALVSLLQGLSERDLVLCAISGGGSTLLCLPNDRGCEEEGLIVAALTRAGATIQELNTVRKHLSLARGGYLAQYAYPAQIISLIFSDVPGDEMEFVASGPTMRDTTTIADARTILEKYHILAQCGITDCGLVETPKEERFFNNAEHLLAVSNTTALEAMAKKAREFGFNPIIVDMQLTGEVDTVIPHIMERLHTAPANTVLLYGGETTVSSLDHGRGGRNVRLALTALSQVRPDELLMTLASDGRDNGPLAGAIADSVTAQAVRQSGEEVAPYLNARNEYPLWEKIGNFLETGDTGSNVSDLIVCLKEPAT